MNKLDIARGVVKFVVGAGASTISAKIIANHVQPENVIQKVTVTSGSVVIGMMVADASKKFVDTKIDEYVDAFRDMKKTIKEAKQEQ
jgi:hypothetical protein